MTKPPDVLSTGSVTEKRVWDLINSYMADSGGGGGGDLAEYQLISEKDMPDGYVGVDSGGGATLAGTLTAAYLWINNASLFNPSSGILRSNSSFLNAGAVGTLGFQTQGGSDTQPRAFLRNDGHLLFGPGGSTAPDVNLYRDAASVLRTDGVFHAAAFPGGAGIEAIATGGTADGLAVIQSGDVGYRAVIRGDGSINWSTGAAATDTNLYRSAAGALKTDGSFHAANYGVGSDVPGNDCNNATGNGWYAAEAGATNSPGASYYGIFVVNITDTSNVRQMAYDYQSNDIFTRRQTAGVWQPWAKVF